MVDHFRQTGDPELDRILAARYQARNARIQARQERSASRRIAALEAQLAGAN